MQINSLVSWCNGERCRVLVGDLHREGREYIFKALAPASGHHLKWVLPIASTTKPSGPRGPATGAVVETRRVSTKIPKSLILAGWPCAASRAKATLGPPLWATSTRSGRAGEPVASVSYPRRICLDDVSRVGSPPYLSQALGDPFLGRRLLPAPQGSTEFGWVGSRPS